MIEVQLSGRLGNNLFQYAVCRSVAERNGFNFYIDPVDWIGNGLIDCDLGVKDGKITNYFTDVVTQDYNPDIFNVPNFTQLIGCFQTEKYFKRDDVKKWFKIKHTPNALSFIRAYPPSQWCYVNVRGTDQHTLMLTLSQNYYNKAVNYILQFNDELDVLVITDDIDLGREYFPNAPIFCNDRDTDFCILNLGKYVVSAISTFCWWACYLNDENIVIAPAKWFFCNDAENVWQPRDIRTDKFIWI